MSKVRKTLGVVIDSGAEHQDDPRYDAKLKVRIFDVHGYGELATFDVEEKNYVSDDNLPWIDIRYPDTFGVAIAGSETLSIDNILSYKAYHYEPGDLVLVESSSDINNRKFVVTGLYAKYSEELYNGIDVQSIVDKAPKFELNLDQYNNSADSGDDSTPVGGNYDSSVVNQNPKWKKYFGCPFSSSSDYSISCEWHVSGSWSCGWHTGIDFSGPAGTNIMSVGDGIVVSAGWDDSYGNHVIVKHSIKGTDIYTLYAHMQHGSLCVSSGNSVKGTQNGQKGTKLGQRGSTGNSSGPHLHFEVRYGSNTYNGSASKNPREFIAI